jgi:hypothetical protein
VGSIDQTLAELTCVSCEASERVSVHQAGSNWKAGQWTNPADMFVRFISGWTGLNVWPKLDNAKCLSCGSSNVQVTYPNPELIH